MTFSPARSIFGLLSLAMLGGVSFAQSEPEEEVAPPAPKLSKITLGVTGIAYRGHHGSTRRLGTPDNGLTVEELAYLRPGSDISPFYQFAYRGLPDRDTYFGGSAILPIGKMKFQAEVFRRRYQLAGISPTPNSEDRVARIGASHDFGKVEGYVLAESIDRDVRPEPPGEHKSPRVQRLAAGFQGSLGELNGGLSVNQLKTTYRDGLQPKSVVKTVAGELAGTLGSHASFIGFASHSLIQQQGSRSSSARNIGLAAGIDLGPVTVLRLDISRQDISLPNVQTAYDRQRYSTGARLVTRVGQWSLQTGFQHREAERVRADRTMVDVPAWNSYDLRMSGRISSNMRLSLKGKWDDLLRSATPNTDDPRQLLWDDKAMGQAKLDFSSGDFLAYCAYTYRFRQNKTRQTEVDWHNLAIGLSTVLNESLSGYAEVSYDSFRGGERVEGTNERLSDFFPNSANLGAGVTYVLNPQCTLGASINAFSTNNLWGSQLSLSYQRQLTQDRALHVVVAPWTTHDRLLGQTGSSTNRFSLTYSIQF